MDIIAKFKGKDGSEGYVKGETYKLLFRTTDDDSRRGTNHFITIWKYRNPSTAGNKVVYSSLFKFLENWEVLNEQH